MWWVVKIVLRHNEQLERLGDQILSDIGKQRFAPKQHNECDIIGDN